MKQLLGNTNQSSLPFNYNKIHVQNDITVSVTVDIKSKGHLIENVLFRKGIKEMKKSRRITINKTNRSRVILTIITRDVQ